MRDKKHYLKLLESNPTALVGFSLAAAAIYAARYGSCEPSDHGSEQFRRIARVLHSQYGETLHPDQVRIEMDRPEDPDATRTSVLPQVRVTEAERERVESEANAARLSIGAYIRRKLDLD